MFEEGLRGGCGVCEGVWGLWGGATHTRLRMRPLPSSRMVSGRC